MLVSNIFILLKKVTTIIHFLLIALSNAASAEEANSTPNGLLPHRAKDSPIAGISNEEESQSPNSSIHKYYKSNFLTNIPIHYWRTLNKLVMLNNRNCRRYMGEARCSSIPGQFFKSMFKITFYQEKVFDHRQQSWLIILVFIVAEH